MKERKTIIKKWDSFTGAVKEEAFLTYVSQQEGFQLDTLVVDSRDESSIAEAFEKFGVMILDDGIYLVVSTSEIDKLAIVINKIMEKMEEFEKDVKSAEEKILKDIFDECGEEEDFSDYMDIEEEDMLYNQTDIGMGPGVI